MNTVAIIHERLSALSPKNLEVHDDSARHAGHAGARDGGGHFSVDIVSEAFVGLRTQDRHRRVYALLADLMPRSIHALSLRALAPGEL